MLFNKTVSKIITVSILCILFTGSQTILAQTELQTFPKGKIYLKSGQVLEGKNLKLSSESVALSVNNSAQSFKLTEIQQIKAKQGKGKKWAVGSSIGCFSVSLLSILSFPSEVEDEYGNTVEVEKSMMFAGAAIWAGIFYGAGYLIGNLADNWQVVYYGE